MSDTRTPENRWWRFAPRSRFSGYLTIFAGLLLLASSGWYLLSGEHGRSGVGVALDVVICVLAVLMIIRAVTGLAATRRGR